MANLVGIEFKFPALEEKFNRSLNEIHLFIAANIQYNRGMLFDKEGAYNGHKKWAPLRLRNGQILSKRGTLRKSIAPFSPNGTPGPDGIVRFAGETITVGTKMAYARIMNDGTAKLPGGVIRAKNAKALKIPVDAGFIAAQKLREGFLLDDFFKEDTLKRQKSLERRMHQIQDLIAETKDNKKKRKREAYLARIEKALKTADQKEIERLTTAKKTAEGSKGNFIFRKSVKIEPRPFDDWTPEDQEEMEIALRNKLVEILNA